MIRSSKLAVGSSPQALPDSSGLSGQQVLYETTTLCPTCNTLLSGQVVGRADGIFVTRSCPEHGQFEGLVCSDMEWYAQLPRFDVEPARPPRSGRSTARGCPEDCGLCPSHRQIAGTAAIEISNHCNARCPVCLADNRDTFHLTLAEVREAVEGLLRSQESVDALALSGGEPTLHPELFEILRIVDRPEIGRILLNSNGLRIAGDDRFLDQLARHPNVYVLLHCDGGGARAIRGVDPELQERALARLIAWGINAVPLVLAAQGVNEQALGPHVVSLLTRAPEIKSVALSMMTYTGSRGSSFPGDPRTRLTIPGALDQIEAGSGGRLRKRDFIPLPMPNPLCVAIGYFLVEDQEITALVPLAEQDELINCIKNHNFARADEGLELLFRGIIDRVYARPDDSPSRARLLATFRQLLLEIFPKERPLDEIHRKQLLERRVKSVYLMQFMDSWTFDSRRLPKCSCHHLLPDGSIVPSCGYYAYHRRFDPRFGPG